MKAETFVKIGMTLAFVTALLFWQDVWGWINSKPPMDIAMDILGFCLKWFYLALLAFLMATLPHYVKPWLRLFKRRQRMAWRSGPNAQWKSEPTPRLPRMTAEQKFMLLLARMNMNGGQMRQPRPPAMPPMQDQQEPRLRIEF